MARRDEDLGRMIFEEAVVLIAQPCSWFARPAPESFDVGLRWRYDRIKVREE